MVKFEDEKKKTLAETFQYVEIYKAGFIDGFVQATGTNKQISWNKIWKKCARCWEKRFRVFSIAEKIKKDQNQLKSESGSKK